MQSCTAPLSLTRSVSNASISSILSSTSSTSRPTLARQKKRVSFDAVTSSFHYAMPPTPATATFFEPSSSTTPTVLRRGSKDLADEVDLRAVLAAGISEWRNEVGVVEGSTISAL